MKSPVVWLEEDVDEDWICGFTGVCLLTHLKTVIKGSESAQTVNYKSALPSF